MFSGRALHPLKGQIKSIFHLRDWDYGQLVLIGQLQLISGNQHG